MQTPGQPSLSHSQSHLHTHTHTHADALLKAWRSVMDLSQQAVAHMEGSVWNRRTCPVCLLCVCAHMHETTFAYDRAARPARIQTVCPCQKKKKLFSTFSFFFDTFLMLFLFLGTHLIFNGSCSIFKDLLSLSTDESSWSLCISIQFSKLTYGNLSHYFCLPAVQTLT